MAPHASEICGTARADRAGQSLPVAAVQGRALPQPHDRHGNHHHADADGDGEHDRSGDPHRSAASRDHPEQGGRALLQASRRRERRPGARRRVEQPAVLGGAVVHGGFGQRLLARHDAGGRHRRRRGAVRGGVGAELRSRRPAHRHGDRVARRHRSCAAPTKSCAPTTRSCGRPKKWCARTAIA